MKNINKKAIAFTIITFTIALSILATRVTPEEIKYSLKGINPIIGLKGIFTTIQYYTKLNDSWSIIITALILMVILWRLYRVFSPKRRRL